MESTLNLYTSYCSASYKTGHYYLVFGHLGTAQQAVNTTSKIII